MWGLLPLAPHVVQESAVFHFSSGFQWESVRYVLRKSCYVLLCPTGAVRCHFIIVSHVLSVYVRNLIGISAPFCLYDALQFHSRTLLRPGPVLFYSMLFFFFKCSLHQLLSNLSLYIVAFLCCICCISLCLDTTSLPGINLYRSLKQ